MGGWISTLSTADTGADCSTGPSACGRSSKRGVIKSGGAIRLRVREMTLQQEHGHGHEPGHSWPGACSGQQHAGDNGIETSRFTSASVSALELQHAPADDHGCSSEPHDEAYTCDEKPALTMIIAARNSIRR